MRILSFLLLSGLLLTSVAASAQTPKPTEPLAALLKASRWQKRVLLLYAPTATDARLSRQRQLLQTDKSGLDTRDLLVCELPADQLSAADKTYLREKLDVPANGFAVVLIGKDGGVKRRESAPVAPASLFSTIDQMPMRQQEMRRQ